MCHVRPEGLDGYFFRPLLHPDDAGIFQVREYGTYKTVEAIYTYKTVKVRQTLHPEPRTPYTLHPTPCTLRQGW